VRTCVICGGELHPLLDTAAHPTCMPFEGLDDQEDPFSQLVKRNLTEVVLWADKKNPRSLQVEIGPSEIGDPCDRRIGYKLARVKECNTDFDPWAAVMGTALHAWLQDAFTMWNEENITPIGDRYLVEQPVNVGNFVKGHSDLYDRELQCVIDHKGAGPEVMKKVRKDGPPPGYVVQLHCYGYGYEQQGLPVNRVALAFYPRAGWLKDMYVWSAEYDRSVAEAALHRLYRIAHRVVELDALNQSHRWEQIDAVPSNSCGFCPWYNSGKDIDIGADLNGCPGR
jgi:hypothetical protein